MGFWSASPSFQSSLGSEPARGGHLALVGRPPRCQLAAHLVPRLPPDPDSLCLCLSHTLGRPIPLSGTHSTLFHLAGWSLSAFLPITLCSRHRLNHSVDFSIPPTQSACPAPGGMLTLGHSIIAAAPSCHKFRPPGSIMPSDTAYGWLMVQRKSHTGRTLFHLRTLQ